MKPEIIDNVNKPSHYQGANGLEAIDVVHNFVGDLCDIPNKNIIL